MPGRKSLLCASLGAALIAGVAGGTAAAAADRRDAGSVADAIGAATGTSANTGDAVGKAIGTYVDELPAGSAPSADAVAVRKKKGKPAPVRVEAVPPVAAPAWVDPNPNASVTSCYGPRWGRLHAGVDLASPHGSPILAAGAGVVVRAGEAGGYGNAILIDHGNGYLTHYGHLSTIEVREGQRVRAGEEIGKEGSTGHSTGPHLHFEVHRGFYQNPIEPTAWLHARGVDLNGCS